MSSRAAASAHQQPDSLAAVDTSDINFDTLRAQGLAALQVLCGQRWTDHNLHDPGITLLEQLCFGLTDIVYRAGFPVADHLAGPGDDIPYADQSLHLPSSVLPCRPTTAGDYRRHLLDAIPELDNARLQARRDTGLYQLQLTLRAHSGTTQSKCVAAARAAYHAQRNLGEDLEAQIACLRHREYELHADIDIAGSRDVVDILAELYDRCARYVANEPVTRTFDELRREGRSLEEIYTGPAVQHGFIDDDTATSTGALNSLDMPELVDVMRSVPGVQDARLLALAAVPQADAADSVVQQDEDFARALRLPSLEAPPLVTVRRRSSILRVAWQDVRRRLDDMRAGSRAQRAQMPAKDAQREAAAMPKGQYRELHRYTSVQQHLPAIYGLGRHGPGANATPQRKAEVKQLKAYLLLQEQAIAQSLAQLARLRELFSVTSDTPQGLWTQMIGADAVPGVLALYPELATLRPDKFADELESQLCKPFDTGFERKNLALDHLLALHGETYTQNSMRQFLNHYKPREAERLLLDNKATWLRDIVPLTRDRAGGFDPGRPSWNRPDNCGGVQRRASLLLGFKHWHDRPLTQVLRDEGLEPVKRPDDRHQSWILNPQDPGLQQAPAAGSAVKPVDMRQLREDLQALSWLHEPLPGGLWRAAQIESSYRLLGLADGGCQLALGPDENGLWWRLGRFGTAQAARRAASSLRLYLRGVDQASEGLHLVEHVLLRPLHRDTSRHDRLNLAPGFHHLAVTAVLPNWTQRTARPAFRRFARETLRICCPAHLVLYHLPLDAGQMQEFETHYAAWLEARRAWCQRPADEAAQWAADGHACELITLMRSAHRALAKAWTRPAADRSDTSYVQGHA